MMKTTWRGNVMIKDHWSLEVSFLCWLESHDFSVCLSVCLLKACGSISWLNWGILPWFTHTCCCQWSSDSFVESKTCSSCLEVKQFGGRTFSVCHGSLDCGTTNEPFAAKLYFAFSTKLGSCVVLIHDQMTCLMIPFLNSCFVSEVVQSINKSRVTKEVLIQTDCRNRETDN